MSSKKNRNKKKRTQSTAPVSSTAEKLNEQLNTEDEEPEVKDTVSLLAEYEREENEAKKRKEERLRAEERERAEITAIASKGRAERTDKQEDPASETPQEKSSDDVPEKKVPEKTEKKNKKNNTKKNTEESDVKQFVPHTSEQPPKESFTEGLNEALSENYDEISDDAGTYDGINEQETAPEKPNRFFLIFAVFVIIMSIIGFISTVSFVSGIISNIVNRTELKNELALFLYPIVSVDPPDCDDAEELPSTIVVEAAIWRIILTGDNTNYEKLYNTYMYVPAIDVEYSVRSIFGNTAVIKHQTVGTMEYTFTYMPDTNSYLVPINPHYTAYSPRITDVTNVGELYTVTVEYIPPSALAVEGIEFEVSATKTMVYTLSKSKNVTTLHSIKNITRIGSSYEY